MKILFIPLDTYGLDSNEHVPSRLFALESEDIIGIKRNKAFFNGVPNSSAYLKFAFYAIRVFFFGIKHRRDFDVIYCFEAFNSVIGLAISMVTGKSCVRDTAGVSKIWCNETKPGKLFAFAFFLAEKIVTKFVKATFVLSDADKSAYIEAGFDEKKLYVIPLCANLALSDEIIEDKQKLRKKLGLSIEKKIIIFTGRREYPPNMAAVEWINNELAPKIAQLFTDVQIIMTSTGKIPQYVHPIISFTGFVPNLFEYIHAADIFISPIEQPSGTQQKVIDAMACGKPMVVMKSLINGIPELIDGYNSMLAEDKHDFINKTIYLLEQGSEAEKMGLRSRKIMVEFYNQELCKQQLLAAFNKCLGS